VGAAKEAAEEKAKELVKAGHTLFPGLESYRDDWNFKLLDRYEPVVTPYQCCYCVYGPFELSGNKIH